VVVPHVYAELSTDRVLVLEYLRGTPLSAVDQIAPGERRDVARRLAAVYATMIFEHGFFHGDPHPGNVLVLPDGRLGLLDFGLAKELPPGFAAHVAALLRAAMAGDAAAAIAAARATGFVVADGRGPELLVLLRAVLGDYGNTTQVMKQLGRGAVIVPSHFTLIARVMVLLNGVSHMLVPGERVIAGAVLAALAPHVGATRQYA
jgi:ubiquinone biosynthesis protein